MFLLELLTYVKILTVLFSSPEDIYISSFTIILHNQSQSNVSNGINQLNYSYIFQQISGIIFDSRGLHSL